MAHLEENIKVAHLALSEAEMKEFEGQRNLETVSLTRSGSGKEIYSPSPLSTELEGLTRHTIGHRQPPVGKEAYGVRKERVDSALIYSDRCARLRVHATDAYHQRQRSTRRE